MHGFFNLSLRVKVRHLTQLRFEFLQHLNDYSANDLVLKLVDFLASRYASLTTKSSHVLWSVTSRNLNQFFLKLVCSNQHEKFYQHIKFDENLRCWFDWRGPLTWNDPLLMITIWARFSMLSDFFAHFLHFWIYLILNQTRLWKHPFNLEMKRQCSTDIVHKHNNITMHYD